MIHEHGNPLFKHPHVKDCILSSGALHITLRAHFLIPHGERGSYVDVRELSISELLRQDSRYSLSLCSDTIPSQV